MQPVARRRTVFFCNKLRSLATSLLFVVDPGNLPLWSNRFVPSISFPFFYNTHLLVVLFYTADPEASLFFLFFFYRSIIIAAASGFDWIAFLERSNSFQTRCSRLIDASWYDRLWNHCASRKLVSRRKNGAQEVRDGIKMTVRVRFCVCRKWG